MAYRSLLCLAIMALSSYLAPPVLAAQYVVDQHHPQASDDNPGTAEAPWLTISQAAKTVQPGDIATIRAGLYREALTPWASGTVDAPITFQAARNEDGTYEEVIISGADVFTKWEKDGSAWRCTDREYGLKGQTYSDDFTFRREQVMCGGAQMKQVASREELQPGTFWIDDEQQKLYVRLPNDDPPDKHVIEVSVRHPLCGAHGQGPLTDIHLLGLTFRYSCNRAQWGAVGIGSRWLMEDCTVEWTIGCGLSVSGENYIVRRVKCLHNGQMGMGGSGVNSLIEECEFSDNNWKGFSPDWEAGGFKLCGTRGIELLRCTALRNVADGMWFDIDDFAGEVRQCRAQHNTRYGIFIEISGDFLVTNNLCTDNGEVGICVAESRDCYVAFNTCVNNQYGIIVRGYDLPRSHGGTRYAYRDENVTIRNNLLAYNSAAGFDLHWDWSKVGPDRPESRTLDADKVGLLLDHNFYVCPDAALVKWTLLPWRERSRTYEDIAELREERGLEHHGIVGQVQFVDRRAGDYRLTPESAAVARLAGMRYPAAGMDALVFSPEQEPPPHDRPSPWAWSSE